MSPHRINHLVSGLMRHPLSALRYRIPCLLCLLVSPESSMLEKRHCKATVVRSEICTPAFAAESVRHFMRQEVDLAADVQRNLTAAISALEELEQHQNPALGPSLVKGGHTQKHLAPSKAGATAAFSNKAAPYLASPAVLADTQTPQSVQTSKAKKDKLHKKLKKRKAQAEEQH